jgi:hypothetical protein
MNTFIDFQNSFDTFLKNGPDRFNTFKISLNLFLQRNGKVIVETGCQRQSEDWGAGMSTFIFGKFIKEFSPESKLFTVDLSDFNIQIARSLTREYEKYVNYFVSDSLEYLKNFQGKIDLLYLDSYDWTPDDPLDCQTHQLNEFLLAEDKLTDQSIVLLDDNDFPDGGKTKLTKDYLEKKNWLCLLDAKQSLWIKK